MDERELRYRGIPRNAEDGTGMRSLQMSSGYTDDFRFGSMVSRKYCCASGLAVCVLGVICGVLLGHFAMRGGSTSKSDQHGMPEADTVGHIRSVEGDVTAFLNKYDYETTLRTFVEMPKLGGTEGERTSAEYVAKMWKTHGLEDVHLTPYKAYFSHPDPDHHSQISIIDSQGKVVYSVTRQKTGSIEPYLAYSASTGSTPVVAEVVYANYGRPVDFAYLHKAGINVTGRIVVIRFGRVFRGNKVKEAEKQGASAVILYPDPADYALQPQRPFPESMSLPASAVASGTLSLVNGDPLTPVYPATEDAFRIPLREANLPGIPAFTASFEEAAQILSRLDGPASPEDWTGDLNIGTYRLGPGFTNAKEMKLEVHLKNGLAMTYNVIGKITGVEEPEKLVLVGNHRDAWTPGAFDPVSGTVALMAIAEAYGKMAMQGWRPRRTLVFCSWGAEEFGLIGSQEWVEQHRMQLDHQAVAYLNVDIAVQGNGTLEMSASPLLAHLIWESTKKLPNPDKDEVARGRTSVFDTWLANSPSFNNPDTEPRFLDLASDSDYAPFYHELGIPSVDIRYACRNQSFDSCLPLYHTIYENEMAYKMVDKEFLFLRAVTQLLASAAHQLAVPALLPHTVRPYAAALNESLAELRVLYATHIEDQRIDVGPLVSAVESFSKAADAVEQERHNSKTFRNLNNKLMLLERAFIDSPGILAGNMYSNHTWGSYSSKHVVFGVSFDDANVGSRFTALKRALVDASPLATPLMASLTYRIRAAADVLKDSL
ncbi:N-acetylated-alpha-linked acidic dipeptidase 2 [Rhipicephalus sanguineus]|uniref:N-acetylated-alpha-linked acidic dipeptidase 2 n=1 Tax=Rhipicephalus sanguineus TaxID=34632 RepID=UPI001895D634|nr:N-acetylated-alpha-linked acidic dipeptidase 2 [Rhipicephalus sanguineus]